MKKTDLKAGYLIELRNGQRYFVMPIKGDDGVDLELVTQHSVRPLDWYDDNLVCTRMSFSCPYTKKEMDIMKVYGLVDWPLYALRLETEHRELLWERKEPKKMTVSEIESILGYEVEIVSEK